MSGEGDQEAELDKSEFIAALRRAVESANGGSCPEDAAAALSAAEGAADVSDLVTPDGTYQDDLARIRAALETARVQQPARADSDSSDFFSDDEAEGQ